MARSIWHYVRRHHMNAGNHLTELELVDALRVSRTPIRGALSYLAERGIVERRPHRGYFLKVSSDEMDLDALEFPETAEGRFLDVIASEWFAHQGPQSFSEREFRIRHGLGRLATTRILSKLSDEGIVSRNRGHGWHFEPSLNHKGTREESYAFRMVLEPGAIRLPAFELDHGLADLSRRDHEAALHSPVERTALATLTTIDAAFHRLIGVSSRNRHVLAAIERQNTLRGIMRHASWNKERMLETCAQHLEILAALNGDDRENAAQLMEHHLESARRGWPSREPGGS